MRAALFSSLFVSTIIEVPKYYHRKPMPAFDRIGIDALEIAAWKGAVLLAIAFHQSALLGCGQVPICYI
jgi:hypothetical protein